jgi:hypothetical protein
MLRVAPVTSATLPFNSLPGCTAASCMAMNVLPMKFCRLIIAETAVEPRIADDRVLGTRVFKLLLSTQIGDSR